jgi:hypothetical protein
VARQPREGKQFVRERAAAAAAAAAAADSVEQSSLWNQTAVAAATQTQRAEVADAMQVPAGSRLL